MRNLGQDEGKDMRDRERVCVRDSESLYVSVCERGRLRVRDRVRQ